MLDSKLGLLVKVLGLLHPEPVVSPIVTEDVLDRFRGRAQGLAEFAIYAPYAADYLFSRTGE